MANSRILQLVAVFGALFSLEALTWNWTAGGGTSVWFTGTNWNQGSEPGAGGSIQFTTSSGHYSITNIPSFTFTGSSFLTITSPSNSNIYTLNATGGSTFSWDSTGSLTFSGSASGVIDLPFQITSVSTFPVVVASFSTGVLNGVIEGFGTSTVSKGGGGTLTLGSSSNSSWSWSTAISDGILAIANASYIGTGTITFDGSSPAPVLEITGSTQTTSYVQPLVVASSNAGEISITNSGSPTFSGAITLNTGSNLIVSALNSGVTPTFSGSLNIGAGNASLNANVSSTGSAAFTGDINITSGATLYVDGTGSTSGAVFSGSSSINADSTCTIELDGGFLQLEQTNSSGAWAFNFNGGTVSVATADNMTGGPLNFGGGTLQITGTNSTFPQSITASGNSTISIADGAGSQTFTGPLALEDGGFLTVNTLSTNPSYLEGEISGGGILVLGPLTYLTNSMNNYSGGTLILGTVGVANSQAFGAGPIYMSGTSTLQGVTGLTATPISNQISFATSDESCTFDSNGLVLALSGGINDFDMMQLDTTLYVVDSSGMGGSVILTGTNNCVMGMYLNSGILGIGNVGALGTGTLTIAQEATFQAAEGLTGPIPNNMALSYSMNEPIYFDSNGLSMTLSGVISDSMVGSSSLTILDSSGGGTGIITLSGSNTYVEPTIISSGQLAITGSITSNVTIGASGTLSGTGVVTGAVINNGKMSPGASPGTMTINGSYTDNTTFVNAITPTQSSQLIVNGVVTINDSTFQLEPDPTFSATAYQAGTQSFVVITSPDPIVGSFASPVISTYPLLANGTLSYAQSGMLYEVVLTLVPPNPLSSLVLTGNSRSVASALDVVFALTSDPLMSILTSLQSLTTPQIDIALNQMQPSLYKGMAIVQENNSVSVRQSLTERLQVVLDNDSCPPAKQPEKEDKKISFRSKKSNDKKLSCERQKRAIHIWASGIGDFLHQSSVTFFESPQVAYGDSTGGVVSGIDYNFCEYFYAGALGAYTGSRVKWAHQQGRGSIDSGYAGLYLSGLGPLFYGNFSLIGGWSNYNGDRNISYPGVDLTASNSHHGQQLSSHLDAGLNIGFYGIHIRPFDSLDWIVQRENSFVERGAGEWDLSVKNTRSNMLRNELGVDFAMCWCVHETKASFDLKGSWVREVRMSGKEVQSAFAAADTVPFVTIGFFPNRNLVSFGASANVVALKELLTCTVYYNGLFGRNYSDNGIGAQVNLGF